MSLLMDALKRAEKARQAQAEQTDASGDGTESSQEPELSLDPLSPSQMLRTEGLFEQSDPSEGGHLPWDIGETGESTVVDDATDKAPAQARPDIEDASLSMDFGNLSLDDDTSATLPSMKSAQRSVDDYFDGTHSMSMSMEQLRPAVEEAGVAAAPAKDHLAGTRSDATTKETAQAVFNSKVVAPSSSRRVVSLVVLPLLVLGLIVAAGFMYWEPLLEMVNGKPSLVRVRPRQQVSAPPVTVAVAPATQLAEQPVTTIAEATLPSSVPVQPDSSQPLSGVLLPPAPVLKETPPQTTTAPTASEAQIPVAEGAAPDAAAQDDNLQAMADQALQEALPTAPVDLQAQLRKLDPHRTAQPSPVSFRITRNRHEGRVHKDILKAYEAFQAGANDRAMAAYREVLKLRPEDRDALLGVAALEMRAGHLDKARSLYYQLLSKNPRDALVQSALISLREDVDPVAGESAIKNLLEAHPGSANLHFNLGNLYARQLRWSEAQQSYFNAYRLDVKNPDYAYNLAISLDHLANPRSALQFYQLAVELADSKPASFQRADALQRIGMLSAAQ